jgi:hypothetical protein
MVVRPRGMVEKTLGAARIRFETGRKKLKCRAFDRSRRDGSRSCRNGSRSRGVKKWRNRVAGRSGDTSRDRESRSRDAARRPEVPRSRLTIPRTVWEYVGQRAVVAACDRDTERQAGNSALVSRIRKHQPTIGRAVPRTHWHTARTAPSTAQLVRMAQERHGAGKR